MSRIEVPYAGPLSTARLVVVGESPGEQEEKHGVPFWPWAPSGKILTQGLGGEAERERVLLTNVSKVRPAYKESPAQRQARLVEWTPVLGRELQKAKECRTLLLVGADAMQAVLGSKLHRTPTGRYQNERSIMLWHGSVLTRAEV